MSCVSASLCSTVSQVEYGSWYLKVKGRMRVGGQVGVHVAKYGVYVLIKAAVTVGAERIVEDRHAFW